MKNFIILLLILIAFPAINAQVNNEPCYQRIGVEGGDFNINYEDGEASGTVQRTITQPGTNAGFTLDIFSLDNSFNMEINGVDLATAEIEFQSNGTSGINIRFKDGSQYESSTQEIWRMTGNAQNPLIRVHIDEDGIVKLWGSKVSGGPLYELELFAGNSLNTIYWNPTTENTIVVRQNVVSTTTIDGTGYGISEIPCEDMYTITKEGTFNDVNGDGYAESGDVINYVFEIKHIGNYEPIYEVQLLDDLLSTSPIELSSGENILGGILTGDTDSNNVLDIGETWFFTVDYIVTSEDIYTNHGVYNRSSLNMKRETGQELPIKQSVDPTPYQEGDKGWDPSRKDHTYVSLKGRRSALSNPILLSRGRSNE